MAASRHPVGSCAAAGTARPAASTSHRKPAASTGVSTTMPRKSARNPLLHFRTFSSSLSQNGYLSQNGLNRMSRCSHVVQCRLARRCTGTACGSLEKSVGEKKISVAGPCTVEARRNLMRGAGASVSSSRVHCAYYRASAVAVLGPSAGHAYVYTPA